MLVCTYLPVCPFVPLGPSHLFVYITCFTFHFPSPSCQWGFIEMRSLQTITRWRTHLSGPCSKVFVLPNDLTTLLLTSFWTVLGDWGIPCSVVNYQAPIFTEPLRSSSWCVCPVVVLSWLDNLLNFFCMCLFASQVQIPAHHLPRLEKSHGVTEEISFEAAVELNIYHTINCLLKYSTCIREKATWATCIVDFRQDRKSRGPMWPQNF